MKTETITCDRCKKEIGNEYSNYPVATRYWKCEPVYCKPSTFMYSTVPHPDKPKEFCSECFKEMIK